MTMTLDDITRQFGKILEAYEERTLINQAMLLDDIDKLKLNDCGIDSDILAAVVAAMSAKMRVKLEKQFADYSRLQADYGDKILVIETATAANGEFDAVLSHAGVDVFFNVFANITGDKKKRFRDGAQVQTSPVVSFDENTYIATTRSGTRYLIDKATLDPSSLQELKNAEAENDDDNVG